jgi:hypothetical protein
MQATGVWELWEVDAKRPEAESIHNTFRSLARRSLTAVTPIVCSAPKTKGMFLEGADGKKIANLSITHTMIHKHNKLRKSDGNGERKNLCQAYNLYSPW